MKGGGSNQPTTTKVVNSDLPEYAKPYYEDLMARAGYESALGYTPYGSQRLAYFTPMETEAIQRMGALGMSGTPADLSFAGQTAGQIAGQQWNPAAAQYIPGLRQSYYDAGPAYVPSYQAGQIGTGGIYNYGQRQVGFEPGTLDDPEMISRYMSPYMQNVVDTELREAMRRGDIRNRDTSLTAAGEGSLGGYREAIVQAENERNLMDEMTDIQRAGLQSAWTDAKQSYEADRAARSQLEQFEQSQFGMNEQVRQRAAELMQQGFGANEAARQAQEEFRQSAYGMYQGAQQAQEQFAQSMYGMNEQARQYAAQHALNQLSGQLGVDASRLAASQYLGDLAGQRQSMEMDRLQQMLQAGEMQRMMHQQGLDIGYEDFLRQQAWPREQISFLNAMLRGVPISPGETITTYGRVPSMGESLVGSGIAAAGLYNAFKG